MAKDKKHKKNKHKEKAGKSMGPSMAETADRHVMYQAAVQAVDVEVEFLDKTFRQGGLLRHRPVIRGVV
ncbi:MAG: hypothetical protein P8Z67_09845 [Gammaproteobacteria bacterium]